MSHTRYSTKIKDKIHKTKVKGKIHTPLTHPTPKLNHLLPSLIVPVI